MRSIYLIVGVSALVCLLAGLFFSINTTPVVLKTLPSSSLAPTKSEPTTEVQSTSPGQDPFKKFLEEKTSNLDSTTKSESQQSTPSLSSKDPFKEFLEKKNQTSNNQVVSPFGKN
jgi:hypothetical protein